MTHNRRHARQKETMSTVRMPTERMWNATRHLAGKLAKAVSEETSLVKARKQQERDLDKLGRDPSTVETRDWQQAASQLKLTELALKDARAAKVFLAQKLQECVDFAAAGREYADTDLQQIEDGHKQVSAPLFEAAMRHVKPEPTPEGDVGESDQAAAGKLKKTKQPAAAEQAAKAGADTPLATARYGLSDAAITALREVGLITLNDVKKFMDEGHKLATVDGISKDQAKQLADTVHSYFPPSKPSKKSKQAA